VEKNGKRTKEKSNPRDGERETSKGKRAYNLEISL